MRQHFHFEESFLENMYQILPRGRDLRGDKLPSPGFPRYTNVYPGTRVPGINTCFNRVHDECSCTRAPILGEYDVLLLTMTGTTENKRSSTRPADGAIHQYIITRVRWASYWKKK